MMAVLTNTIAQGLTREMVINYPAPSYLDSHRVGIAVTGQKWRTQGDKEA